ncbi:MFS transporter [Nocardioides panzhihuensis]|uniref:MFS family permease n=1 Tax=Nocardioides panzhihuensis TaxID=860243 RepID=A0A7Z0DKE1_9ACTN|nr:MFS transporter [Nocardioides panzhihuensis]NYI77025.1 MFS family permease [Nocardioides panzhihuensis]
MTEHMTLRRTDMGLLWVSQFVNTAGLMALVPIMPLYMASLGASDATVGVWAGAAIAAPALPLAITTPLWGRLGDRIGPKWMVVRALAGLCLAMALMAAAGSPLALLAARIVQGTLGGVVEAAAAYVGSAASEGSRGRALGRSYSATAAGALTGPVAGGTLVATGDLRPLLIGIALAALLLGGICTVRLRNPHDARRASVGAEPARAALVSMCARIGWIPLTAGFLAFFGVYGLIPIYTAFVTELVPEPQQAGPWVGGLHAVMWGGTLVGSLWWGKVNDRTGLPLRTLVIASGVTAATVLIQATVGWLPALVPLRFIQGFCFAALAQSLMLYASQKAGHHERAGYVGAANSFLLGGQFLGPLMAGGGMALLSPTLGVLITGICVAAAALLVSAPAIASPRSGSYAARTSAAPSASGRRRSRSSGRHAAPRRSRYRQGRRTGRRVRGGTPGHAPAAPPHAVPDRSRQPRPSVGRRV